MNGVHKTTRLFGAQKALVLVPLLALSAQILLALEDEQPRILILEDGSQVAVSGELERRPGRVVFTDDKGTLRSIRDRYVDWPATERFRQGSEEPAREPAVESPGGAATDAVRITNRDVGSFRTADQPAATEADSRPAVFVESWERTSTDEAVVVEGILRNTQDRAVVRVHGKLELQGFGDEVVDRGEFRLRAIPPGGTVPFRVSFASFPTFSDIRFSLDWKILDVSADDPLVRVVTLPEPSVPPVR